MFINFVISLVHTNVFPLKMKYIDSVYTKVIGKITIPTPQNRNHSDEAGDAACSIVIE